jgi:methyl-accepting chemotaxis protein PixJ
LLVAHQCGEARVWQQEEVNWIARVATEVGKALYQARLFRRVEVENSQLQILKRSIQLLRDRPERDDILKVVVEAIRKAMKVDRAIVCRFDANWSGTVVAESVISSLPKTLGARIKDSCFARAYAEKRNDRAIAIDNIYAAQLSDCCLEQLEAFAVRACLVAPIEQNGQLFGLLIVQQCIEPRQWQQSESNLLIQLVLQASMALDRAFLEEEKHQAQQVAQTASQESQQQQAIFQRQISELIGDSITAFERLSQEVSHHSEAIATFLAQIHGTDAPATESASVQQIAYWEPSESARESEEAKDDLAWHDIVTMQDAIAQASEKINHLNQSYQQIFEAMERINALKEQASLPMAERANNPSIDAKRLRELSAETKPSFAQTQNLALTNQFLLEMVDMTSSISEEFTTVSESFNKLLAFLQKQSNSGDRS